MVKRAGIHFTMLTFDKVTQQNFFSNSINKNPKLMSALDQINAHFGPKTVRFASQSKTFSGKIARSPKYTTEWTDILEISI